MADIGIFFSDEQADEQSSRFYAGNERQNIRSISDVKKRKLFQTMGATLLNALLAKVLCSKMEKWLKILREGVGQRSL